ncbi:MAG: 4.9 kDa unknown protein [Plant associated soymovirus 1]|nr:MAG: 4.9 kDa unknown protein [Plant associated soymovirus 1]
MSHASVTVYFNNCTRLIVRSFPVKLSNPLLYIGVLYQFVRHA